PPTWCCATTQRARRRCGWPPMRRPRRARQPYPLTPTIATSRSQIVSGESVRIAITLHNASHYELDFHLATGETAPATAFARRPIIWACSSGCGARPIPPGSDFQDEIIVSKLFDLTVPAPTSPLRLQPPRPFSVKTSLRRARLLLSGS